jgi:hypothetical protein
MDQSNTINYFILFRDLAKFIQILEKRNRIEIQWHNYDITLVQNALNLDKEPLVAKAISFLG